MEKSMMYNPSNPFPEEMITSQPTEAYPPMEELPRKPPPPQYAVQPPTPAPNGTSNQAQQATSLEVGESPIIRQEGALTAIFAIRKLNDFLRWFLMVLEVTLLIEFFLMLIGAAQNNLFAGFMYALTVIPLYPFSGIVPNTKLGNSDAVIDWSILIAMAVYFLVFYALRRFLSILSSGPEEPGE
jgi:YGGT family protein